MANLSFGFLKDSFLFREAENNYSGYSVDEINDEINKYKTFIRENQDTLETECIEEDTASVFLSEFSPLNSLPEPQDVLRGAFHLQRMIIDDPLYSTSLDNMDIVNQERLLRGLNELGEEQIKETIRQQALYMKEMTPAVRIGGEYVKFFPLSASITDQVNLETLNVPDLSLDFMSTDVINWFEHRIEVRELNAERKLVKLTEPCIDLGISFRDDPKLVFLPSYRRSITTDSNDPYNLKKNIIIPKLPNSEEFNNWISQEKIKSIRDRFNMIYAKYEYSVKFGAPLTTNNAFEAEFFKNNFNTEDESTLEKRTQAVTFQMDLPTMLNADLETVMEVRKHYSEQFENFRNKLREDAMIMRELESLDEVKKIAKELEEKYKGEINSLNEKIKKHSNFSSNDLIPIGLDIVTLCSVEGALPGMTTGVNLIHKLYNAVYKVPIETKGNPIYFLYKTKESSK